MFLFKSGAPFSLILDAFLSADISVRPKSHWKVLVVQYMGKSSAFTNELLFLDCVAFKLTRNNIVQERETM